MRKLRVNFLAATLAAAGSIGWGGSPDAPAPLARDAAETLEGSTKAWYDAHAIGVEGMGFKDTETTYSRLPARAKEKVPGPVWGLSQNTAGLAVRFVTDSSSIAAYWDGGGEFRMNHMAATGIAGLDLYEKRDGVWTYRATGRPTGPVTSQTLVSGMEEKQREYLLYLPLYHNVLDLKIGVDTTATLAAAPPRKGKPVVFYGTSITQGGCASRSGMGHVAILGRWLDVEMINLGFSGNGRGEMELAQLVSEIDAQAYVLEPLPNMNLEQVRERIEPWVRLLRGKHPDTPILLVENPLYEREAPQNQALKTAYENLKKAGVKKLWLLPGSRAQLEGKGGRLGDEEDGTVDGVHPTDLGFLRMAEYYLPVMKEVLGR